MADSTDQQASSTTQPVVDCKSILTLTGLIPSSEITKEEQAHLNSFIATLYDTRPHVVPAHPVSRASLDYIFDVVFDDESLTAPSRQHKILSSIIKLRQSYREAQSTHQDIRDAWDEYDEYTSLCCELGRAAAIAHNEYVDEHGKGDRIDVNDVYGTGPSVYCPSRSGSSMWSCEREQEDDGTTDGQEDYADRPGPAQRTTL